jgi:hypothetical protein
VHRRRRHLNHPSRLRLETSCDKNATEEYQGRSAESIHAVVGTTAP